VVERFHIYADKVEMKKCFGQCLAMNYHFTVGRMAQRGRIGNLTY
jgi:hypothetical protein